MIVCSAGSIRGEQNEASVGRSEALPREDGKNLRQDKEGEEKKRGKGHGVIS